MLNEHVLHFSQIVVLQSAHRHDVREIGEIVDFDELVDELLTAKLVDLGDDGNQRDAPLERTVLTLGGEVGTQSGENTLVAGTDFLIGGQQEGHHVHIGQRFVDHVVQTLAEQRTRTVNTGRVHEHELRVVGGQDAANRLTGGFRARGCDGNLLADQRVDQRGFADVRAAHHGHESGAIRHVLLGSRSPSHRSRRLRQRRQHRKHR